MIRWADRPKSVPELRFAGYLQQFYEPCETIGAWRLKSGVNSVIDDIYKYWKEKFNIKSYTEEDMKHAWYAGIRNNKKMELVFGEWLKEYNKTK